jgi:hypothetical protein
VSRLSGQMQWENTKRKGRCQCHASGNGHGENYGYLFHGNLPFSLVCRLPGQRKQIRDSDHVLELLGAFGSANGSAASMKRAEAQRELGMACWASAWNNSPLIVARG